MKAKKTMLLIDADNVSVDVMEQAVQQLLAEHGALHVRRAYCTAESALKHQQVFKRLSIRPMVNLAAGKNSTDIALAVDAMDLVLAERPDVVVIASSDSDFAPLVARLREKGCRVVGIGQQGKTGDETQEAYDAFSVLAHRKGRAAVPSATARAEPRSEPRAEPRAAPKPVLAAVPAKRPSRRRAPAAAPTPPPLPPLPDKARAILQALPELGHGEVVELRVAAERLREAGLLSRSGASTKLFGQFPELFELQPQKQPNHVRALAGAIGLKSAPRP
jgi:uncharacterized protein (TIGR00288 family)